MLVWFAVGFRISSNTLLAPQAVFEPPVLYSSSVDGWNASIKAERKHACAMTDESRGSHSNNVRLGYSTIYLLRMWLRQTVLDARVYIPLACALRAVPPRSF